MSALKCMVMPLIFSNMVLGVARMRQMPNGGPMGRQTVLFGLATTSVAAIEGLILSACLVAPFTVPPLTPPSFNITGISPLPDDAAGVNDANVGTKLVGVLKTFIPKNIVHAMGTDQLLAVIMFSIVMGLYIDVDENNGRTCHILGMAQEINDFTMKGVDVVIRLTPIGLFGLVAPLVITMDLGEAAANLGILVFSHALGQCIHMFVVYPLAYFIVLRSNPFPYLLNCVPAMITALATSSSAATLPTTFKCAVKKNNIPEPIANFVLSVGAAVTKGKLMSLTSKTDELTRINSCFFFFLFLFLFFFFFLDDNMNNRRQLHRI